MSSKIHKKEPLVSVVDTNMDILCAMPYDSVVQQKLLYVRLVTCFKYKGAMLLNRTPTNRWSVTCVVPLLYGTEKEALLTDTISGVLGIEGSRHTECVFIAPTFTQPYCQYYYSTRVPCVLHVEDGFRASFIQKRFLLSSYCMQVV